jgi:hypothetical protein
VLFDVSLRPFYRCDKQYEQWRTCSVRQHCASNTPSKNSNVDKNPSHLSPWNTLNAFHKLLKLGFGVLAYKSRSGKELDASVSVVGASGIMKVMCFVG